MYKTEAIFIYAKNEKIKVLNLSESRLKHKAMISWGWKHTATLNPLVFIKHLFGCSDIEIVNEIRDLGKY